MDMQSIQNFFSTTVADLAVKVLAAIAFWIVGRWPVSYTHLTLPTSDLV